MVSATAKDNAAPIHAARRARSCCPAPMQLPMQVPIISHSTLAPPVLTNFGGDRPMNSPPRDNDTRPLASILSYHAHIYFDPASTRTAAETLRQQIAQRFAVQMGRWHEAPVGPHSLAMYQVAFTTALFASFVPWLMINRGNLNVLVHPNTLAPRDDHLRHALWLGQPQPLIDNVLPLHIDAADESAIVANTSPSLAP